MPTVQNPTLTLTTVNQNTTISVSFDTVFSEFERQLHGLGMTFHPHVDVIGVDPAGSTTGTVLSLSQSFPKNNYNVTAGSGDQTIPRTMAITVGRAELQEDPTVGGVADDDEIRCKIRIHSVGLPPDFTEDEFTPQQILIG